MKTIYDLKLHEDLMLHEWLGVIRVPGGWVYNCYDPESYQLSSCVFVPFNNEFQDENTTKN